MKSKFFVEKNRGKSGKNAFYTHLHNLTYLIKSGSSHRIGVCGSKYQM